MPRHFILGFMNLKTGKVDSAKTEEYPGFGKKVSVKYNPTIKK